MRKFIPVSLLCLGLIPSIAGCSDGGLFLLNLGYVNVSGLVSQVTTVLIELFKMVAEMAIAPAAGM